MTPGPVDHFPEPVWVSVFLELPWVEAEPQTVTPETRVFVHGGRGKRILRQIKVDSTQQVFFILV